MVIESCLLFPIAETIFICFSHIIVLKICILTNELLALLRNKFKSLNVTYAIDAYLNMPTWQAVVMANFQTAELKKTTSFLIAVSGCL